MNADFPDYPLAAEWREEWSRELAEPLVTDVSTESIVVVVFQLGAERFSLPASAVVEITRLPAIHRLPFRGATTGIVNVRGRIAVCAGLDPLLSPLGSADAVDPRLIVLQDGGWLFATRVDAVDGVHRLDLADCAAVPPPQDPQKFTIGLWTLAGRSVARLDERRLFAAVKESLS